MKLKVLRCRFRTPVGLENHKQKPYETGTEISVYSKLDALDLELNRCEAFWDTDRKELVLVFKDREVHIPESNIAQFETDKEST